MINVVQQVTFNTRTNTPTAPQNAGPLSSRLKPGQQPRPLLDPGSYILYPVNYPRAGAEALRPEVEGLLRTWQTLIELLAWQKARHPSLYD